MRRSHALTLLSLVAALGGCGDGHEYPLGFAEQAARDEAWFKAQDEAQKAEQKPQQAAARSGQVAPPRAPRSQRPILLPMALPARMKWSAASLAISR